MSTRVAGDDAFAPVPNRLSLYLEYQVDARQPWQQLRFNPLGVLQFEGPFVHDLQVPKNLSTQEMRVRVLNWPIYYSLDLQKLAKSNQYGKMVKAQGIFRNAIVICGIYDIDNDLATKLLATHMAHHVPLGFDMYFLYVRGSGLLKAILANEVTSSYVDKGFLQVVSLDSLQFPGYDDARVNTAHPFHPSYDAMKLVAYNHAALMLWGERFHLAAMDIDEFYSTGLSQARVNLWFDSCYPGSDVLSTERIDVICNREGQDITELRYFQRHWNASYPTNVLKDFDKVVGHSRDPKSLFWPDKVGQVWLHMPESLQGSKTTIVSINTTDRYNLDSLDCVIIVHLYNLFKKRVPDDSPAEFDRLPWS